MKKKIDSINHMIYIFIINIIGTSQGHFLFLETSAPRKPDDRARVISSVFAPTTGQDCHIRFWYHMYGMDVAQINVYTRTYTGGPLTQVWHQNGEKGDEWLRTKIVLQVNQPFQVLIEGVRGAGYEGKEKIFIKFFSLFIYIF